MYDSSSSRSTDGEFNSHLVDRFFEDVMNDTNASNLQELVDPDVVIHHPFVKGPGVSHLTDLIAGFRSGFPDLHYVIEDRVTDAAKVAVRWVATGTHTGAFANIPPTNRRVTVGGTDIFRVSEGRLAEMWVCSDLFGLFQQLGDRGS